MTDAVQSAIAALGSAIAELPEPEFQEAWVALGMIQQALARAAKIPPTQSE